MTGPGARDPLPGEPEHRPRWQAAARPDPREVEEAKRWLRENPASIDILSGSTWSNPVMRHAAVLVRAALAADAVEQGGNKLDSVGHGQGSELPDARYREGWEDALAAGPDELLRWVDCLRARVAELEVAGNALYQLATDPTARDAWRSTAGAPTEQPGDGIDPTIAAGYRLEDIRDLSPRDLGFGADGHSDEQAGGDTDA